MKKLNVLVVFLILTVVASTQAFSFRTFIQTYQILEDAAMEVLGLDVRSPLNDVFAGIERELDSPFRLSGTQPTNDNLLHIGSNQVMKGDGTLQTTAPSDDQINIFAASTINYQTGATTGGTVEVEGVAFTLPACTVGQRRYHYLTYISSDNKIDSKFSTEDADPNLLPNIGSIAAALGGTPIGYLLLDCTDAAGKYRSFGFGGTIIGNNPQTTPAIFRFGSGAGGGAGEVQDFKLQAVADPEATIKKGYIGMVDGSVMSTYDGAGLLSSDFNVDLVLNLDDILGDVANGGTAQNPLDATLYQLVIDLSSCCQDPSKYLTTTDTKQKFYPIQEANFKLLEGLTADEVSTSIYFRVGEVLSASTGTVWSGTASSFNTSPIRVSLGSTPVVSPLVYDKTRTIGTVGSVANDQGALVDSDFTNIATSAYYGLNGDASKTGGTLGDAILLKHDTTDPVFTEKGFFGRENVVTFTRANDDRLTSSDVFFNPGDSTDWTMGLWVYFDSWEDNSSNYIAAQWSSDGSADRGWYVSKLGGEVYYSIGVGAGAVTIPTGVFPKGNGWHYVSLTYDSTANIAYGYYDGVNVGSMAGIADTSTANMLILGGLNNASDTFDCDCSIQDFSFEHRKLSDAEVNARYSKRFSNHQQIAAGHVLTNDSFPFSDFDDKYAFWNLTDTNDQSGATACVGGGSQCQLTNNGGITFGGLDIFGQPGIAEFDGVDDYFSSVDGYFNQGGEVTIGGFFSLDDWTPASTESLFNTNPDGVDVSLQLEAQLAGTFRILVTNTNASWDSIVVTKEHGFINGSKHHILVRFRNGVGAELYVDGVFFSIAPNDNRRKTTVSSFNVGVSPTGAGFMAGSIEKLFYVPSAISDEDIKKLYAAKITTDLTIPVTNQDFSKSLWGREDGKINNQLIPDWVVDNNSTEIYLNTGLPSGSTFNLKIVDNSFSGSVIASRHFDTGLLSGIPTFPINHGLPSTPASFYVLTEGQTTPADWDERHDLCSADETELTCDLSGLVIDTTHRVRIVANMASGGVVVQQAEDSLGSQSIGSVGSIANAQGALVDGDFPNPANVAAFSLSGNAVKTAGTATATFTQSGTSFDSVGFFGREDMLTLTDDGTTSTFLFSSDAHFNPGAGDFSAGGTFCLDYSNTSDQTFFSQWETTGTFNLLVRLSNGVFDFRVGGTQDSADISAIPLGDSCHHIAMTHDVSVPETKYYIDGNVVATGSTASVASTSDFKIGARDDAELSTGFNGSAQDFFFAKGDVYTTAQINHIYSKRFTNHNQIAAGHVLTDESFPFTDLTNKVSYFNLTDETDDSTANTKDLINNGTMVFTGSDIHGTNNSALFDGVNDYLSSTDAFYNPEPGTSFGAALWVNLDDWSATFDQDLVTQPGTDGGFRFGKDDSAGSNGVFVLVRDSGGAANGIINVAPNFINGSWHHLAFTKIGGSSGTMTMYFDGVSVGSTPYTSYDNEATANFNLGAVAGSALLKGKVDEFSFWHGSLSDEDIHKLYSSRIIHNKNKDPKLQSWRASYEREDGKFALQLENGWQTTLDQNSIYVDFNDMDSGAVVTVINQ